MPLSFETPVSEGGLSLELQVRLFGPFTVSVGGAPLPPLRTRKGAWLLALLILRNDRPVDRIWLAGVLWPDSDHRESLKNLRDSLHDLRRALGPQAARLYSSTPGTLRLDLTDATVDLIAFDAALSKGDASALDQAVRLYRGPLLEGCEEEWVVLERARREQSCLEALEALAAIEIEAGMAMRAVPRLRTCVGMDPLRETAQRALMSALAAIGDYAGVTQTYREFRLLLHEELQTQPAAETTALYQQIRARARQTASSSEADLSPPPCAKPTESPSGLSLSLPDGPDLRHNLPPALTSFIGREKEIAQVKKLLETTSLLSLTGVGGSGKTRLSLQVARDLLPSYPDGVWLVELAPVSDPALVVQTAASVLKVREQSGTPLLETLVTALASRRMLLLLDNCEHLLAACAQLAAALLRACPDVRLLATSRERMGIAGERIYRTPSLSLPDLHESVTVENIGAYEAVSLFVERAGLIRSDFVVNPHNAPTVASVCCRLDGNPLAIELAAAWVRSLSVEDINARLDHRFRLLTGGDRSALPRQQSLRALIDWSYDLLSLQEKALFMRLAAFAGGWTLEAAEQVGSGEGETGKLREEWEVLDSLTALVDKSLVLTEEREGGVRYRLFETVRQYARERLQESGKAPEIESRHRDHFLALAEKALPALAGADQQTWLERLEAEHDNLRSALSGCLKEVEGAPKGLRLAGAMWRFWYVRGYLSEGRMHLGRALEREGAQERTSARALALNGAGNLAHFQGDHAIARALHEECLAIRRELGDRRGMAASLGNLGNIAYAQSDYAAARALHAENLTIARELEDRQGIAASLGNLGNIAYDQGDYVQAQALHEECLTIQRELGDRSSMALSLNNLALVTYRHRDYVQARALHAECLTICREIGDSRGIANALNNLGNVDYAQTDYVPARSLYEESLAIRRELGDSGGIAQSLGNLGNVACDQGDYRAARSLHEDSLTIRREMGDRWGIASSLYNLGLVAAAQGDHVRARSLYEESLTIQGELGDREGIADTLEGLADVMPAQGRTLRAIRLWGAAQALREKFCAPVSPRDQEAYDRREAQTRPAISKEAFAAAWEAGRNLPLEAAITEALEQDSS